MSEEFKPINTQEEFDAAVTERYGDVANLQQQLETVTQERDTHANSVATLQAQVKGYQTAELRQKIAREKGIPAEMANRLTGETEKDIRADADAMATALNGIKGPAPMYTPSQTEDTGARAGLKNLLRKMKGE